MNRPDEATVFVPVRGADGREKDPFPFVDLDDIPAPRPKEES